MRRPLRQPDSPGTFTMHLVFVRAMPLSKLRAYFQESAACAILHPDRVSLTMCPKSLSEAGPTCDSSFDCKLPRLPIPNLQAFFTGSSQGTDFPTSRRCLVPVTGCPSGVLTSRRPEDARVGLAGGCLAKRPLSPDPSEKRPIALPDLQTRPCVLLLLSLEKLVQQTCQRELDKL